MMKIEVLVAVLVLVLCCLGVSGEYVPCDRTIARSAYRFFDQKIDHFGHDGGIPSSSMTFKQRYYVISEFFQAGGPILFLAGPENTLQPYALPCSSLISIARETNALIVAAEHRYYGESLPTSPGYAYLTIDNALADYNALLLFIKATQLNASSNTPVVVFGGSYGGFLSYMMRIKYPDTVNGSIASSAPVFLYGTDKPDSIWYDTISAIFTTKNHECAALIDKAFGAVWDTIQSLDKQKMATLSKHLNLCAPISSYNSGTQLMRFMMTTFSQITEFNYPWKLPNKVSYPFDAVCNAFISSPDDIFAPLRFALDVVHNVSTSLHPAIPCFCHTNNTGDKCSNPATTAAATRKGLLPKDIRRLSSTAHLLELSIQYGPWLYQTCREFVQAIAGTGIFHYPLEFNFDSFKRYCKSKYNVEVGVYNISVDIIRASSNIVLVNGGFDPVSGVSVTYDLSDTVTSIFIEDAAHTQDMFPPSPNDLPSMIDARQKILQAVKRWTN